MNRPHENSIEDIERLVKTSKDFQNKLRHELLQETLNSRLATNDRVEIVAPPVVEVKRVLNSNVKSLVIDIPQDNIKSAKKKDQKINSENCEQFSAPKWDPCPISNVRPRTMRASGSQKTSRKPQELLKKVHERISVSRKVASQRAEIPRTSKTSLKLSSARGTHRSDMHISPTKAPTSSHRLPLQRFCGKSSENIDFATEHPNLELDSSSEETTLFPRRVYKGTKLCNLTEKHAINVASADVKEPTPIPAQKQETWKDVLLKNHVVKPQKVKKPVVKPRKVLHPRKNDEVVESCVNAPQPKTEDTKGFSIITTARDGLFQLEKPTAQKIKQNKCHQQSFPVMYIRPECRVQQVVNISIRGDDENTKQLYPENVKYVECKHKEESVLEACHSATIVAPEEIQDVPLKQNKFFNALDTERGLRDTHTNKGSSTSSSKLSYSMQSRTSTSSNGPPTVSQSKPIFSSSPEESSDNDVHHIIARKLQSTKRPLLKINKKANRARSKRREVHVQTDTPKENVGTSPIPLPPPIPQELPTLKTFHYPTPAHQSSKQEDDNCIEDDIITKIFERIRNDVPSALEVFKRHHTSTNDEEVPLESRPTPPIEVSHQQQKPKNQPQTSAIRNTLNVELPQNKVQSRLERVQVKKTDSSHTQKTPPPVDLPAKTPPSPLGDEGHNLPLLQQNPLFVQTINWIKSSAVDDAVPRGGGIKESRHKYPTDTEIKRAVKIFLDALTIEERADCGSVTERKSIIKCGGTRSNLTLSSSKLIGGEINTRYDSSAKSYSSNSSSESKHSKQRKSQNIFRWGVSSSSTSTALSLSDSDSESVVGSHLKSSDKETQNGHSEGEVLSLGEI